MSPQPRPRSKDPRPDDEVLTPDDISGPDDELDVVDEDVPRGKPDRRALWAMLAGLSAIWFALLGSILSFVLAAAGIILGWRAMRHFDRVVPNPRERRKAKIGFIAGIVTALFIIVQIALFALFFEWDKSEDDLDFNSDKTAGSVTTEPNGEPEG